MARAENRACFAARFSSILLGRPKRHRPVGRPRYRRSNEVQKDLKDLGTADWQEQGQNREVAKCGVGNWDPLWVCCVYRVSHRRDKSR